MNAPLEHELQIQRDEHLEGESWVLIALLVIGVAIFILIVAVAQFLENLWRGFTLPFRRAWQWLNWRRRCAWCKHWIGGNPRATQFTDGICQTCNADMRSELSSGRSQQTSKLAAPPVAVRTVAAGNSFENWGCE